MPARGDSALFSEGGAYGATDASSRQSQTVIERILGGSLSVQALEANVAEAAGEVSAFDDQPAEPLAPALDATILVVQADGTGVPMVPPSPAVPPVRLGKGQKRGKQKAAVVTGLSTIAPYRRTPQAVVAALLHDPDGPQVSARPAPRAQERHATLEGKTRARRYLVERVARREGPHLQHRVARSDGAEALHQQVLTHLPQHTLVLDIIHATASLWDTAKARLGDTHPHRTVWVRHDLEPRVAGPADAVSTALEEEANDPSWTAAPRQAVRRTVGSDRRHRPSMRDDEYVAQGWPMGTGVIEGACRHLVNDRLEPSGRRWTKAGAQAGLNRRAVRLNAHGDRSWPFHRHQQHRDLYGNSAPMPEGWERQALQWAA